jgi:hypothetical protein
VGLLLVPAGALTAVADDEAVADSKQDAAAPADAGSEQQTAAAGAAAVTTSTINFVDLAGSERGSQVAESGEKEKLRQKEVRRQAKQLFSITSIMLARSWLMQLWHVHAATHLALSVTQQHPPRLTPKLIMARRLATSTRAC